MAIRKVKKIEVGDEVFVFGIEKQGKVEKISGAYYRIEGIGVKHADSIERLGKARFCQTKTIESIRDLVNFLNSIPDELAYEAFLEVNFLHEEIDSFAQLDESHKLPEDVSYNEETFDPYDDLCTYEAEHDDNKGVAGLKNWGKEIEEHHHDSMDNLLVHTDEDGFRTHIVINLAVSKKRAKAVISLKYVSDPIHLLEGMEDIEQKIKYWFTHNAQHTNRMMEGLKLRSSILTPEEEQIKPGPTSLHDLSLVDNLLKDCLILWPEQPYGSNSKVSFSVLFKEYKNYTDFIERVFLILELIKSKGVNQPDSVQKPVSL